MNVMVRPRRAGKTHTTLELLKANPGSKLIVRSTVEKKLMEEKEPDLKDRIIVYTGKDSVKGKISYDDMLIVDNVEFFLRDIFGVTPAFVTTTGMSL